MTVGPVDVRYKGQTNVQTGILNLAMRTESGREASQRARAHRTMSEVGVRRHNSGHAKSVESDPERTRACFACYTSEAGFSPYQKSIPLSDFSC